MPSTPSAAPADDDATTLLLSSSIGVLAARPVTPLSAPAARRPTSAAQPQPTAGSPLQRPSTPSSTSMGVVAPRPATPMSAGAESSTKQSPITPLGVGGRRPSSATSDARSGNVDMSGCKRLPSTPQPALAGGGGGPSVTQATLGLKGLGLRAGVFEQLLPPATRSVPAAEPQSQPHQLSNREIAAAREFLTSAPGKRPSIGGGLEASKLQRRPASAPNLSRPGRGPPAKPNRNLEADQAAAARKSNFTLAFVSNADHSKMYMQSTYTSAFPRRTDTTTPFKKMANLSFAPTML